MPLRRSSWAGWKPSYTCTLLTDLGPLNWTNDVFVASRVLFQSFGTWLGFSCDSQFTFNAALTGPHSCYVSKIKTVFAEKLVFDFGIAMLMEKVKCCGLYNFRNTPHFEVLIHWSKLFSYKAHTFPRLSITLWLTEKIFTGYKLNGNEMMS